MSSSNPRVSVTLKPKTAALLRRLSEVTGNSISSIIGDLLEDSEPVYERAVRTLEAARMVMDKARAEAVQHQKNDQRAIHQRFYGLEDAVFEEIEADEQQPDLLEGAETIQRRAGRPKNPRPVTRGSGLATEGSSASTQPLAKPRQSRKGGKNGEV